MKPRYCAPIDFGQWHITEDGERTLCGIPVKEHHLSGVAESYHQSTDCAECALLFREPQLKGASYYD